MRDGSMGAADPGQPTPPHHQPEHPPHYRTFCPAFPSTPQPYIYDAAIPLMHRCTMACFRWGTHWLATHTAPTAAPLLSANSRTPTATTATTSHGQTPTLSS